MATRPIIYKGRVILSEELNLWGTLKDHVGEGFCKECERPETEGHYTNCPLYKKPVPQRKGCAECGSTGAHKLDCSKRKNRRRGKK